MIQLGAFSTLPSEPKPWCLINGPVQNMEAFLVKSVSEFIETAEILLRIIYLTGLIYMMPWVTGNHS